MGLEFSWHLAFFLCLTNLQFLNNTGVDEGPLHDSAGCITPRNSSSFDLLELTKVYHRQGWASPSSEKKLNGDCAGLIFSVCPHQNNLGCTLAIRSPSMA